MSFHSEERKNARRLAATRAREEAARGGARVSQEHGRKRKQNFVQVRGIHLNLITPYKMRFAHLRFTIASQLFTRVVLLKISLGKFWSEERKYKPPLKKETSICDLTEIC
jgi:hypothetical protein